jgi:hypothetical protein
MKKKIEFLIGFIKSLKCEVFSINIDIDYNTIEYINPYCRGKSNLSLISNIESIVEEIAEHYVEELYDFGPGSSSNSASDYFQVELTFYPEKNKLIFSETTHTEYGSESSGMSYDISDYNEDDSMYNTFMDIRKFLEKEGIEEMTVSYNGSGDSGYIESDYTSKNKSGQIDEDIEHICYDLLQEYGGWEINEGSQGTIIFTKDEIDVQHEWNTEEQYTNEINLEVKPEDFND